jgi:hypothetical protein
MTGVFVTSHGPSPDKTTITPATSLIHAYINAIVAPHFLHFPIYSTLSLSLTTQEEKNILAMEKQSAECITEPLTGKLNDLLTDSDDYDVSEFSFKEETIEEVMQEFYKEIIACPKQSPPSPTTPLPEPKTEEIPPVVESNDLFVELGNVEVDFDDEWLSRVLNWGQGN